MDKSFVLREAWIANHRALDEDIFYLHQHQLFGRASMVAERSSSYLRHVRQITQVEEEMKSLGLRFADMTAVRADFVRSLRRN